MGSFHSVILTTTGFLYTCGRTYTNSNVSGNSSFLAGISGNWSYTNGPILMDDTLGFQGNIIGVDATGTSTYFLTNSNELYCIGSNAESNCTNTTSTSGYQTTPLKLEGM